MKPLKDKRIKIYKTTYTKDAIGNQIPAHELESNGGVPVVEPVTVTLSALTPRPPTITVPAARLTCAASVT